MNTQTDEEVQTQENELPMEETAKIEDDITPKCERVAQAMEGLRERLKHDPQAQLYLHTVIEMVIEMRDALVEIADLNEERMGYSIHSGPNLAMQTVTIAEDALGITP